MTTLEQSKPADEARDSVPPSGAVSSCNDLLGRVLSVSVDVDSVLSDACKPFDYSFDGTSRFELPKFDAPLRDGSWSVGLIVGPSGSGKSQLLRRHYGETEQPEWAQGKAIVSHFESAADAMNKLAAVGLSSVPSWCRPYHVLSNGEQFRARMARMLAANTSFDEFTSVVDRTVAKSCCWAVQREIRKEAMKGVVFASCHRDIIEWLQPDWVFDTLTASMMPRGCLCRRPPITISIEPCSRSLWSIFAQHHYMSANLSKTCRSWIALWDGIPIGFVSTMPLPSGTTKNAWREHRTVVLPDYQGLGIGVRISDEVAQIHLDEGRRFYSKTAHPRMGKYRDASAKWRPTKHNHKVAKYQHGTLKTWRARENVYLYSHEFTGDVATRPNAPHQPRADET